MSNLTRKLSRNHRSKVRDSANVQLLGGDVLGKRVYHGGKSHPKAKLGNRGAALAHRAYRDWKGRYGGQHPPITRTQRERPFTP